LLDGSISSLPQGTAVIVGRGTFVNRGNAAGMQDDLCAKLVVNRT
jgi:hypothetical protein